jgi:hypothetical protein
MMRAETMHNLLRHPVALLTNLRLVGLHLVLNAALLAGAMFWLLIPEEHVWQLLFTVLSALLMIFVVLWLHGGTFVYATDPNPTNFRNAFSIKLGRMAWMLLGVLILLFSMRIVDGWNDSRWQLGGYLYAKAPHWMRPTGGESGYVNAVEYFFSALFWYFVPTALLPIIAVRINGLTPRAALRAWTSWLYWVSMAACAIFGVWIPGKILDWIPGTTLHAQTVGLVIRLIAAYLLATGAWLAAVGLVGYSLRAGEDRAPAQVLREAVL